MIKTLRRKFIIVAMSVAFGVFILLVGGINAINTLNMKHYTCLLMDILKENGGVAPEMSDSQPNGGIWGNGVYSDSLSGRYFTVLLDAEGNLVNKVDNPLIDSQTMTRQKAAAIAEQLFAQNKKVGYKGTFRFDTMSKNDGRTLYLFIDCKENFQRAGIVLKITLIVGLSGLLMVLVLVLFFSKIVLKPIEESYAKQKRFITDASHELKTPLTVIAASAEVIEMEGNGSEWTESIKEECKRLADLTQKLVFLARMEENGGMTKKMEFCISDAVDEEGRVFLPVCQAQGKRLVASVQPAITYYGDEQLIRRLVALLVDNAVKYSDPKTYVEVMLEEVNKKIILKISNPSKSTKDGNLDLLFERFYRADESHNSATGGHGIGLSVVKAIVDAHKAKIIAKCENGVVSFTVVF